MAKFDFYRSASSSQATAHPVFYYHLPKCGGMTVHSIASHTWQNVAQMAGIKDRPIIDRCDSVEHIHIFRGRPYIFISSHLPFGVHKQFVGTPRLLTILRSPVDRVISSYTYERMRKDRGVSLDDLAGFFHEEENTNLITKGLAGKLPEEAVGDADVERAISNLDQHFSFVGTTSDIKQICECYLRLCGLPNVLSQRINPTLPQFQLNADELREEIRAWNSRDMAVFEHVQERGLVLPTVESTDEQKDDSLNAMTVIISERGDKSASKTSSIILPTAQLLNASILKADGSSDGDALDNLLEQRFGPVPS